jgi:hypothetical protein
MAIRHLPKALFAALAVALLLTSGVAFTPNAASAQATNGPTTLQSCDPPTQGNAAGAPATGVDPSAVNTDTLPDQALIPLWCANDRSSGNSPAVTTPSGCSSGLARRILLQFSGRGLDWVC